MQKPRFACLPVFAILAFVFIAQATFAQDSSGCAPQFAITSPDSVNISKTFVWIDITVTNTGSCEASTTVYPLIPEGWYSGANFTTSSLKAGQSENSSIKIIIPDGEKSAIIWFAADGANISPTKIVIGGVVPEDAANPAEQNQTQAPLINKTATPIINATVPASKPEQQENATEPAQKQPEAIPTTGLVTANPVTQYVVVILLVAGGIYFGLRFLRGGFPRGFKYRYKG
ncbi:MAG: hypothetical protein NTY20_05370 [Candidatus Aenigmarchaeota archaeon]|nr:hypothetical protein [Candidatus Aenigmarchaeota archaeon]